LQFQLTLNHCALQIMISNAVGASASAPPQPATITAVAADAPPAPAPQLSEQDLLTVRICNTSEFTPVPGTMGSACAYLQQQADVLDAPFRCFVHDAGVQVSAAVRPQCFEVDGVPFPFLNGARGGLRACCSAR
jgi:hypothetical protein